MGQPFISFVHGNVPRGHDYDISVNDTVNAESTTSPGRVGALVWCCSVPGGTAKDISQVCDGPRGTEVDISCGWPRRRRTTSHGESGGHVLGTEQSGRSIRAA